MKYYIIIPAHNEESFLSVTLESVLKQTLLPKKIIVVNDNSTDRTEAIIDQYSQQYRIVSKINTNSSTQHLPGSKVVNAFQKGQQSLDEDYDFIVKLDADIILPDFYFERIAAIFKNNTNAGIAGGFVYEETSTGTWELNHPMNKNHVRGAFKAYAKPCFNAIGGLKSAMGWDTVDELLAQYHGYEIHTDDTLKAKHLRPTGHAYGKKARILQGKAMYRMRYGFVITCIATLKMAWKNKHLNVIFNNLEGFFTAKREKVNFLVSEEEGQYIRRFRWRNMKQRLF